MFFYLIVVVIVLEHAETKHFESNWELAYELIKQGFDQDSIAKWVCIVNMASERTTNITFVNDYGSKTYGLFQINDTWCNDLNYYPGKGCHIPCAVLLTDDITAASKCAQKIYQELEFEAWQDWVDVCNDNYIPAQQ